MRYLALLFLLAGCASTDPNRESPSALKVMGAFFSGAGSAPKSETKTCTPTGMRTMYGQEYECR